MSDHWQASARNLAESLRGRGISDTRVLQQLAKIPRQVFVPPDLHAAAYDDTALPIGAGQTISQPYIVALMTEALELRGTERVLEIGTGSGYQAAILAGLAAEIITMERLPELAGPARQRLDQLGITNVAYVVGDGTLGWPEGAPYDGIIVTAAPPHVPLPLLEQLVDGGRLVIPVGPEGRQSLLVYRREGDEFVSRKLCDCRFVRLIGAAGWSGPCEE